MRKSLLPLLALAGLAIPALAGAARAEMPAAVAGFHDPSFRTGSVLRVDDDWRAREWRRREAERERAEWRRREEWRRWHHEHEEGRY